MTAITTSDGVSIHFPRTEGLLRCGVVRRPESGAGTTRGLGSSRARGHAGRRRPPTPRTRLTRKSDPLRDPRRTATLAGSVLPNSLLSTRGCFAMRRTRALWAACLLLLAAPASAAEPTTVFAAASLKNALDAAGKAFTAESGLPVRASYAASSALARQIEQGAPADLFASADLEWMDYLAARKLIRPETRVNLLANRLVVVAPKDARVTEAAFTPDWFPGRSVPTGGCHRRGQFGADRQIRQGGVRDAGAMGADAAAARPGRQRAGGPGAGLPRRGAAWRRLRERREVGSGREGGGGVSGGQPPAGGLSLRGDSGRQGRGRRALPRLSAEQGRPALLRGAGLHDDRGGASQ